jgi:hypothetical protein
MNPEKQRLEEAKKEAKHWRRWGPYLSEREWGTVREDYSERGDTWDYFTYQKATSLPYRWGEDGIGGICDNHQRLCFAFSFWNGEDKILKERLFGLTNAEGNHGEDVKEYYFYLDNTPTHSYMSYLYKYPQSAFPYEKLLEENRRRSLTDLEYELLDTGIFEDNRYFDLLIEYAKADAEDLFIKITATNRGKEAHSIHLIPTLWFRNTWQNKEGEEKPFLYTKDSALEISHPALGTYRFLYEKGTKPLYTENEVKKKEAFHRSIIHRDPSLLNQEDKGTKAALDYQKVVAPGESFSLLFRLFKPSPAIDLKVRGEELIALRKKEADLFYQEIQAPCADEDMHRIQRQAFAGILWNKQFYHYIVEEWLKVKRLNSRNRDWVHVYNDDILSVPDKWEYPCFFAWDTAFQILPLAAIDPEFAKKQLMLLTREWYMHPNGQIPAYEWAFSDVNPPVHAWSTWRVYKIEKKVHGTEDRFFLERVFQKLLLNFTWWVNRKDSDGRNIFQGGFLGLDNISIFNRSEDLPSGGKLYQSDATSWMGMYCLNMLTIALELAKHNRSYEDIASKFFEHFLYIADAINYSKSCKLSLWNEEDGLYYDILDLPDGTRYQVKVHSMVSLIPLFAVMTLEPEVLDEFKGFRKRFDWFLAHRSDLCGKIACMETLGTGGRHIFAIVNRERLERLLKKMLDENEFLSPYGIRSLSKYHQQQPFTLKLDHHAYTVDYEPAESKSKLYGGNSNWRGPVWFPLNMLIIESLQKYHHYYGDTFKVECPTGSGKWMNLWEVAGEISKRLMSLFLRDEHGKRPIYGGQTVFQEDPHWKDLILFYEYFHGDNGAGIGASHQTGWTGLIAKLIQQYGLSSF